MFEQRYARMNHQLHPQDTLIQETLAAASHPPQSRIAFSKRWSTALVCLALLLATGTAIATSYDFSPLLERWFPATASNFSPVNLSDTKQGVTMTVLQANLTQSGDVELIVGFKGDRVTANSVPRLGYGSPIRFSGEMVQGDITPENSPYPLIWRFIVTPGEANTDWYSSDGYFALIMTGFDIDRKIISENHGLSLSSVPQAEVQQAQGLSVMSYFNPNKKESITTLVPGEPLVELPEGMAITAIGYLPNGQFVIQARIPNERPLGNSCSAWLVSRRDAFITRNFTDIHMWWDEENGWIYREYLFDISPQELYQYQLHTACITVAETLADEWCVTIDVNHLNTKAE